MEQQFLSEILKTTFTVDSFKKRYLALKLLLEKKIYESEEEKHEEKSDDELKSDNLQKDKKWAEDFDKKLLDQVTNENFKSLNEYINKFIEAGALLSIYFVFIPDHSQVEEIGNWLRKSLNNPNLIFDVKVDPGLIGGCAIAYKGVYKDYSLKARIEGEKSKLMEQFRKYFKN